MKNLITVLSMLVITLSFGQDKKVKGTIEEQMMEKTNDTKQNLTFEKIVVKNMAMEVKVDSADDLESTFTMTDIEKMLDKVETGENISFRLTCNDKTMSNGTESHISYKIEGNTGDKEDFLKKVERVREAAINYYKNKN